jgi:hypothetical protein
MHDTLALTDHLWSERFDRALEHVFPLEDEIARAVAERLGRHVETRESVAKPFTSDVAFLRNKPFWDPLRTDPRFDGLLARMKLLPAELS